MLRLRMSVNGPITRLNVLRSRHKHFTGVVATTVA